jgi:hypothetical protein
MHYGSTLDKLRPGIFNIRIEIVTFQLATQVTQQPLVRLLPKFDRRQMYTILNVWYHLGTNSSRRRPAIYGKIPPAQINIVVSSVTQKKVNNRSCTLWITSISLILDHFECRTSTNISKGFPKTVHVDKRKVRKSIADTTICYFSLRNGSASEGPTSTSPIQMFQTQIQWKN